MASRRLIAVLLVLLFLSSLAAALAPVERQSDGDTTSTDTSTTTTDTTGGTDAGELIRERIDASDERPATIDARVGDQLQLEVAWDRVATLEIPDLGPTADVGPDAPARFDLLLTEVDTYEVRVLGSDERIAKIEVSEAGSGASAKAAG